MSDNKPNTGAKKAASAPSAAKPKRTTFTPEQRVARLEAELAEAKAKAEEKGKKQADELRAKRAKLVDQVKERETKIAAIDAELRVLEPETEEQSSEPTGPQSVAS